MYQTTIQYVTTSSYIPSRPKLRAWVKATLQHVNKQGEVNIRIVDAIESAQLNSLYRKKKGPTNILSFPLQITEQTDLSFLGDLVICADVVNREVEEQRKTEEQHWAHMVVHGVLHLLGHDHEIEVEAEIMEALEVDILQSIGIENPYLRSET